MTVISDSFSELEKLFCPSYDTKYKYWSHIGDKSYYDATPDEAVKAVVQFLTRDSQ